MVDDDRRLEKGGGAGGTVKPNIKLKDSKS